MPNCPKCFTAEQYSLLIDVLRIIPPFITALVAIFAFRIGRQYFNKGQSNSIQVEKMKRFYDHYNSISSDFLDFERNINKFFNGSLALGEGEIILTEISDIKNNLVAKNKKGFFIIEFVSFHDDFLNLYDKWFTNSEDLDIFLDPSQQKKKNTIDAIKKEIQQDLTFLKEKLAAIEVSKSKEITLLHI